MDETSGGGEHRILRFDGSESLGVLDVDFAGKALRGSSARGDVHVPTGSRVHLQVDNNGPVDLAALDSLAADDLDSLSLLSAMISDADLAHVGSLTGLRDLDLTQTPIGDAGLGYLLGLTNLRSLWLTRTMVDDAGVAALAPLATLELLDLSGTRVTDTAIDVLAEFPGLRRVELSWTAVSPEGVARLAERLPNCTVRANFLQPRQGRRLAESRLPAGVPPGVDLLQVPLSSLTVYLSCLALGTLTAIRAGVLRPDDGDDLTGLAMLRSLRGHVPREVIKILKLGDEVGILPAFSDEYFTATLDRMIDGLLAELSQVADTRLRVNWYRETVLGPANTDAEPDRERPV